MLGKLSTIEQLLPTYLLHVLWMGTILCEWIKFNVIGKVVFFFFARHRLDERKLHETLPNSLQYLKKCNKSFRINCVNRWSEISSGYLPTSFFNWIHIGPLHAGWFCKVSDDLLQYALFFCFIYSAEYLDNLGEVCFFRVGRIV